MSRPQKRGKLRNPPKGRYYASIAIVVVLIVAAGSGIFLYATHSFGVFPAPSTTSIASTSNSSSLSTTTSLSSTISVATTGVVTAFVNAPCTQSVSSATKSAGTYALVCTNLGWVVIQLSNSSSLTATVNNFVNLAQQGFYNDLVWHRIVPGFVIQTGDPNTRQGGGNRSNWGSGTSGTNIPFQDDSSLHNYVGYVAMASTGAGTGGSSQFYINLANNTNLDGSYSVFGKVVSGMNVVNELAAVPIITNTCQTTGLECDQPVTPASAYVVSITIQNTP